LFSFLFSETGQNDSYTGSQTEIGKRDGVTYQEFSTSEVFLNKTEEFVDIGKNFGAIDIAAISGETDCGNCGLEIAGGDIKPLVNKGSVVEVITVELVVGSG